MPAFWGRSGTRMHRRGGTQASYEIFSPICFSFLPALSSPKSSLFFTFLKTFLSTYSMEVTIILRVMIYDDSKQILQPLVSASYARQRRTMIPLWSEGGRYILLLLGRAPRRVFYLPVTKLGGEGTWQSLVLSFHSTIVLRVQRNLLTSCETTGKIQPRDCKKTDESFHNMQWGMLRVLPEGNLIF